MTPNSAGAAFAVLCAVALSAQAPQPPDGEIVTVASGSLRLKGVLFRPKSGGPVPAVLFHHGGGCAENLQARRLGSRFAERGYAFLWVHRRGAGLSKGQGDCATDDITRVRAEKGEDAAMDVQFKHLVSDELDDAMAGLTALRAMAGIDTARIAVGGHSRGGQLAILSAERDSAVRAVLSAAGGAVAWPRSAAIRARLVEAVGALKMPVYLGYAEDDNAEPGRVLAAELVRLRKPHQLAIYPTGGHGFIFQPDHPSDADVFRFLAEHVRR